MLRSRDGKHTGKKIFDGSSFYMRANLTRWRLGAKVMGNKKNRQRSGKSTQLKGIAKSRKQAKERIYGGKDSSDSSKSDSGDKNENRLVTASDDTSVNESASSRKIAQKSSCEDGERSEVEGFLLLDSKLLCRYLDNVSKCGICESSLKTKPSYADR